MMFKKVNPHIYSILCAHCGERGTSDIYSGIGLSADARQALACRGLLDQGWTCILQKKSYCADCSEKIARGEINV